MEFDLFLQVREGNLALVLGAEERARTCREGMVQFEESSRETANKYTELEAWSEQLFEMLFPAEWQQ